MIFDILSSRVYASKWQDHKTGLSLSFDVVPKGRDRLDIGDDYILCSARNLPFGDEGKRSPIDCSFTITADPEQIAHIKGGKPTIGYAQFFAERRDDFYGQPAKLFLTILIEPDRFNELLALRIAGPDTATLQATIEDLDFGWEPDGSHQIWKLDKATEERKGDRRWISSRFYSPGARFRVGDRSVTI